MKHQDARAHPLGEQQHCSVAPAGSQQLAAVLGLAAVEMHDNSGIDFTAPPAAEAFPQATDGSLHLQQAAE